MSARLLAPVLAEVMTAPLRHPRPGGGVHPGTFRVRWVIGKPMAMLDREVPSGWRGVGELEVTGGVAVPVPASAEAVRGIRLLDPRAKLRGGPRSGQEGCVSLWSKPLLQVLATALREVLARPICRVCRGTLLAPCTANASWTEPCRWCVNGRARAVCDECHEALPLCPCVVRESLAWQAVGDAAALSKDERRVLLACGEPGGAENLGDNDQKIAERLVARGLLTAARNVTKRGLRAGEIFFAPPPFAARP